MTVLALGRCWSNFDNDNGENKSRKREHVKRQTKGKKNQSR